MSKNEKTKQLQEQEFLNTYNPQAYDLLSISVDNVVFSVNFQINLENYRKLDEQKLMVLLVKRNEHPYKEIWSLPGGIVRREETLEQAALRSLNAKVGIDNIYLEQLYTFGYINRDPRMRIISCAYMALIDRAEITLGKEYEAAWFEVRLSEEKKSLILKSENIDLTMDLEEKNYQNGKLQSRQYSITESKLAFDHSSILLTALLRLQNKIEYSDLVFNLLPEKFTITQLQSIYEIILDQKLFPAAFRRKIADRIVETGEYSQEKGHRPSQYYHYKDNMEG